MKNQISMDCRLKLMNFGNVVYKEKLDYGGLNLVEDPLGRSFSLVKDGRKYLTLDLSEIKTLPEHIQRLFKIIEKDVKNISFNLVSYSFILLNHLDSYIA